ncbi:MAG: hypothetical protein AAB926_00435 [Patescibacteria group bacterium]
MTLFGLFDAFFFLLGKTWFIWVPFFLFFVAVESWLSYAQTRYKKGMEWTLLEIRIPLEVRRSPRAMEQFFANIYALRNAPEGPGYVTILKEKYLQGEVTLWFSLEMASFGGEIHFYLRTPTKHKNIVEAQLYAQYPDIEIIEADDYISRMPAVVPEFYQSGFDLAGGEFKLAKPDPYPIATYLKFETAQEEYQLDPISSLTEIFGKLKPEEEIWLQVLIRPANPSPDSRWKKQCAETIEELRKKGSKEIPVGDEGQTMTTTQFRTPGETAVIKVIEESVLKLGFETVIRWLYFSPQSIFNKDLAQKGIAGALNQYASAGLNFFIGSIKAKSVAEWNEFPYVFPKYRTAVRKKELLKKYQERNMPEESLLAQWLSGNFWRSRYTFVLNAEELATIYHLPTHLVLTAPFIRRMEAKRAGPPAGLPLFEE